ncbi:Zinc-transporting ATPase [Prochlorococcus marinus str. MIT 1323]|nr:Zinc-transporting ATPase [Prochlorococcus marinus str. MIT 1323]
MQLRDPMAAGDALLDGCCNNDCSANAKVFSLRRELIPIAAAASLFVIGLAWAGPMGRMVELAVMIPAYLISGWGVLTTAGRNILRGRLFDENFLMSIATIGAICIGELPEAVAVMLFFQIGELFQGYSVGRSRRSIQALLQVKPDRANLMVGDQLIEVDPNSVKVGDQVLVRPGEKVPLDGDVVEGRSSLDTSALTGESQPRAVQLGDKALAGTINQSGALVLQVIRPLKESSVAKILQLVESAASRKAPTEKLITSFARIYTPIVVGLALLVAVLPPLVVQANPIEWLNRALVLVVISCPCGLVISIPLGYFGGAGGAARQGILVKGSMFLDALSKVKRVVFDKTGTLTQGCFRVSQVISANGFSEQQLLELAAMAESQSTHPVAQSIKQAYAAPIDSSRIAAVEEIPGHGIRAEVNGHSVLIGNDRLLHRDGIVHQACAVDSTVVHVVVDGVYSGRILIADAIKPDAVDAVSALHKRGINVSMLTGDSHPVAEIIADQLGLDGFCADLLPEGKVAALDCALRSAHQAGGTVAYVGDGINDAPVIARADVGMAMGALGSDAAIETADVVIMTDVPSQVAKAIDIGKRTRRIV